MITTRAQYHAPSNGKLYLLERGYSATRDYYFSQIDDEFTECVSIDTRHKPELEVEPGSTLVILRYLSRDWAKHLLQQKERFARVVYFADDDIPQLVRFPHARWHYRWKLLRYYYFTAYLLETLCSELWVSSQTLAYRYADFSPRVVTPQYLPAQTQEPYVTCFYYASELHRAEIAWMARIAEQITAGYPQVVFVFIGNQSIKRHIRSEHTLVIHPTSWATFQHSLPLLPHHIGLAPLLNHPINSSRSYTKHFDITRLGAAGIYSDHPVYRQIIEHGENGYLLPENDEQWINSIAYLIEHPEERLAMRQRALQRLSKTPDST